MQYTFEAGPCRAFVIGLIRSHLTSGSVLPSAATKWLAEAMALAADDCAASDPVHSARLSEAAREMQLIAGTARERDDAHYAAEEG